MLSHGRHRRNLGRSSEQKDSTPTEDPIPECGRSLRRLIMSTPSSSAATWAILARELFLCPVGGALGGVAVRRSLQAHLPIAPSMRRSRNVTRKMPPPPKTCARSKKSSSAFERSRRAPVPGRSCSRTPPRRPQFLLCAGAVATFIPELEVKSTFSNCGPGAIAWK